MTKEHRERIREEMDLDTKECHNCGKVKKVMVLRGKYWYCQDCSDIDKKQ